MDEKYDRLVWQTIAYELLALLLDQSITVESFCSRFERVFNLEIDKNALSTLELAELTKLFNDVVYDSPFSEGRAKYPGFLDEAAIQSAAERAWEMLRGS